LLSDIKFHVLNVDINASSNHAPQSITTTDSGEAANAQPAGTFDEDFLTQNNDTDGAFGGEYDLLILANIL
jgi:hypothetical protein